MILERREEEEGSESGVTAEANSTSDCFQEMSKENLIKIIEDL
jgi:hypothetical protein